MEYTSIILKRVIQYAAPYHWHIVGMLILILLSTGMSLLLPLIMRDLIDRTIPSGDIARLISLSLALLALPVADGAINVINRRFERARG